MIILPEIKNYPTSKVVTNCNFLRLFDRFCSIRWNNKTVYWKQKHKLVKVASFYQEGAGFYRSFSLSRNKKLNWRPSSGRSQENECYKRLIYKQFVFVAHSFWVICRNVSRTLVELCMETPFWCAVLVHQYGRRKWTKTSRVHFFNKSSFFSHEKYHTCA